MKRTLAVGAAFLCAAVGATSSLATDLRCGQYIIQASNGAIDYEVLEKCGEPTVRYIDRWIYDRRSQDGTIITLRFAGGKVTSIESSRDTRR